MNSQVLKILRITESSDVYGYIHRLIEEKIVLEESNLNLEVTKTDILKDIPRTYFVNGQKEEEKKLLNVLMAFAYVKPSIGYCQGMNFLGAVVLKVSSDEESAFWLLLGLIKKWEMENLYVTGVPELSLREYQFEYYLNYYIPEVSNHFRKTGVPNGLCVTRWFLTLFATFLPVPIIFQVWDCFFLSGWKVMIKLALSILKSIKSLILSYDLGQISIFFQKDYKTYNFSHVLSGINNYKVKNTELTKLEEQFYTDQVNIKLAALDNAHVLSEKEISAMRWAKNEFENFDGTTKNDISVFQKKIQKLDNEQENFTKHYLTATMDMMKVKKEIEKALEQRNFYQKMRDDIRAKFKKNKFQRIIRSFSLKRKKSNDSLNGSTKNEPVKSVSKEDLEVCEQRLKIFNQELEDLQKQLSEKLSIYQEALTRSQEIKDKKKYYSDQLCEFLNLIK